MFFTLALFSSRASAVPTFVDDFSVNSQEDEPRGLTFNNDGTKMYVIGWKGDDVNTYTLSTAFDVSSTVSFVDDYSLASQDDAGRDVKFNPDGTKMFYLGGTNDRVYEYTLTTAFDVSTRSDVDSFPVPEDSFPNSLEFSTDGTKMFVLGSNDDEVNEYTLSTGFDVSTASHERTLDVTSEDTEPMGLAFNSNGTKMYVAGWTDDDINEYTLSTAWDISTASFVDSFSVGSEGTDPAALAFSSDGSKLFVVGDTGDDVNEYTLSCY